MKVHLAYDDCTLVGVYRRRKDAKAALDLMGSLPRPWRQYGATGIERLVGTSPSREQWIETYEVRGR